MKNPSRIILTQFGFYNSYLEKVYEISLLAEPFQRFLTITGFQPLQRLNEC